MKLLHNGTHECESEERKEHTAFPKWFCSVCNRYVLPDAKHTVSLETEGELIAFRLGKIIGKTGLFN